MIMPADKDKYKPLVVKLAEDIANKIHSGVYNDKIPSVQTFAREYDVNFKTANRAIERLVREKVLQTRRGSGTYVTPNGRDILAKIRKNSPESRQILFFMPSTPHVYDKMYKNVISSLNRDFFFPIPVYDVKMEGMFEKAMELRPAILVIDSDGLFPYKKLPAIIDNGVRVIVLHRAEFDIHLDADYVLSDTSYGAYIATKHLIELGHKRILHLTYESPDVSPMLYRHINHFQMLQGYRLALSEAGLADKEMISCQTADKAEDREMLRRLLSGPKSKRPTAIFANGDSRILNYYGVLRELGIRVPDDLALVGYYDTPNCEFCEVPLTSVSINEIKLAEHTVQIINEGDGQRKRIVVKPELVIRGSSRM